MKTIQSQLVPHQQMLIILSVISYNISKYIFKNSSQKKLNKSERTLHESFHGEAVALVQIHTLCFDMQPQSTTKKTIMTAMHKCNNITFFHMNQLSIRQKRVEKPIERRKAYLMSIDKEILMYNFIDTEINSSPPVWTKQFLCYNLTAEYKGFAVVFLIYLMINLICKSYPYQDKVGR